MRHQSYKTPERDINSITMEVIAPICSNCKTQVPIEDLNTGKYNHCPGCNTSTKITVFPMLTDKQQASPSALNTLSGESSCFNHSEKKAVRACSTCGRFLCTLCNLEIDGNNICPDCLSSGKRKKTINVLDNRFTRYDSIMIALVFVPILVFPFLFFTAPGVILFSIWSWRKPVSLFPKNMAKTILAIIFATIEIAGISIFVYYSININQFINAIQTANTINQN